MPTLKDFDNETLIEYCEMLRKELELAKESLRDKFASAALQGILANKEMGDSALHSNAEEWVKDLTEASYEFADAMLEARK